MFATKLKGDPSTEVETPELPTALAELRRRGFRDLLPQAAKKPIECGSWTRYLDLADDQVAALFRPHWPCGVGAVTGTGAGLLCLDIDTHGATLDQALAELRELEARMGPLPSTFTERTASGGRHLWFRSGRRPLLSQRLAPHVELKCAQSNGTDKVTVAPTAGYTIETDAPIESFPPGWALNLAVVLDRPSKPHPEPRDFSDLDSCAIENINARALAYVSTIEAIEGQGGHAATFNAMCRLVERVTSEDDAWDLAQQWNDTCAHPSWSLPDLRHKLDDALEAHALGEKLETPKSADASATNAPGTPGHRFVKLSTIKEEELDWLAPGWVVRGALHSVLGDKGSAKSTVLCDFLAAMTVGRSWLGSKPRPPATVAIVAQEDGLADTLVPRLRAMGANMDRVLVLPLGVVPQFPDFVPELEAAIQAERVEYLVIDSVMSTLGSLNGNKDQDVRTALMPLRGMLERHHCTAFAVRHLNKNTGEHVTKRGMGSVAFDAVARLVWLCAKDQEIEGRFVLSRADGNLGRTPRSRTYTLDAPSPNSTAVRVVWGDETDATAEDMVARPERRSGPSPVKREEAIDWLREKLASGGMRRKDVLAQGEAAGFSARTLERVAKSIVATKDGMWHLADARVALDAMGKE
jgi:hypothetical protein